jgi:hypothetical protein
VLKFPSKNLVFHQANRIPHNNVLGNQLTLVNEEVGITAKNEGY